LCLSSPKPGRSSWGVSPARAVARAERVGHLCGSRDARLLIGAPCYCERDRVRPSST
jgi:hypothetical protein